MNKLLLSRVAMVTLAMALVAILVTAYVSSILTDNENLAGELKSAKADRDQAMEKLTAVRYNELAAHANSDITGQDNLKIKVVNDGPTAAGIRYLLLYCIAGESCPLAHDVPIIKSPSNNSMQDESSIMMLYPGETSTIQVGPVLDDMRYRVDLVTDRGNILHTEDCMVDLAGHICQI